MLERVSLLSLTDLQGREKGSGNTILKRGFILWSSSPQSSFFLLGSMEGRACDDLEVLFRNCGDTFLRLLY